MNRHEHYLPGNTTDPFVFSDEDGSLYISIGVYAQKVNYCPVCGMKAETGRVFDVPTEGASE